MKKIILTLIVLFLFKIFAFANIDNRVSPFVINEYKITKDTSTSHFIININLISNASGTFTSFFYLPDSTLLLSGSFESEPTYIDSTHSVALEWTLDSLKDWCYEVGLIANINFTDSTLDTIYFRNGYYPLYFTIEDGNIIKQSQEPDTTNITYTIIENDSLTLVEETEIKKERDDKTQVDDYIYVNISGRLRYRDIECGEMKGLPGQYVSIGFNVQFINDGISYTSVPLPLDRIPREHINFDVTDMDGYFNFQFQLDGGGQPLNHFYNNVGIILGGNIDVSTSISIVKPKTLSDISNIEYNLTLSNFDMNIGYLPANAIRYLYRARKFVQAVFGYYPNQAYCTFHNGGNLFEVDWFSSVGNIKFNYFYHPSLDVYHEYGHNIHYDVDGLTREILSSECQNHWFYKNTNSECAWTEGWAEFFAAACADYWQKIENSSTFDYYPSRLYQFMDFSQTQLPSGNRESVEGGVASFLYSLLDNYTIRAPNYSGDNEDVHFPATTILYSQNSAVARYHDQYANSPVEGLRDVLIDNMYAENWSQISYRVASLNSLYDAIIKNDGIARSATPTELNIWGDLNTRFLFWNDNTCPTFIDCDEECYTDAHFNLDENQESGFYIYRKAVTDYNWNGYLTGYSLIHTTSANITSWADEELITPGKYSYVVVAFNNEGISIPSAQVTVDCSTLSRPDNLVLTNHNVNLNEFYSATYSITAGDPYTFTIEPWAGATFCAGQEIILKPGFTSTWSSNFLGKIDDCIPCEPGSGSSPSPNIPLSKPDSIDIVIIENNFISCNPNPAFSSIDIVFKLQRESTAQLIITNSYGQQVYNANVNNVNPTQEQRHSIDISNLPSGLYFVTLRSPAVALTKGVVVIK